MTAVNWYSDLSKAVKDGSLDEVKKIISSVKESWISTDMLSMAIRRNHRSLVEYICEEHKNQTWDWNDCLYYAAKAKNMSLIEYFIKKGANNWNRGMCGATAAGDMTLIEFFIAKGADDWRGGLWEAKDKDWGHLIHFFKSRIRGPPCIVSVRNTA